MTQFIMPFAESCAASNIDGIVKEMQINYRVRGYASHLVLDRAEIIPEYLNLFIQERPEQEQFWVIPLDTKLKPKGVFTVSVGSINSTLAHPREVFRVAIAVAATSVLLAHNHPSGDPAPSSADIRMTRTLREAGKIIGIEVTDHVIIGRRDSDPNFAGFYSFREAGLL